MNLLVNKASPSSGNLFIKNVLNIYIPINKKPAKRRVKNLFRLNELLDNNWIPTNNYIKFFYRQFTHVMYPWVKFTKHKSPQPFCHGPTPVFIIKRIEAGPCKGKCTEFDQFLVNFLYLGRKFAQKLGFVCVRRVKTESNNLKSLNF